MLKRLILCQLTILAVALAALPVSQAQTAPARGFFIPISSYDDDPFVADSVVERLNRWRFDPGEDGYPMLMNNRVLIEEEPVIYRQDPKTGEFVPFAWNSWSPELRKSNADGNFMFPDEARFPLHRVERGPDGKIILKDGLQLWLPQDLHRGMTTAFEAANAAKDAAEFWAGRELAWGDNGRLGINAHAFIAFNAFWSPTGKGLYFGVVPHRLPGEPSSAPVKMFEMATSWEVAAHEAGHALHAELKPNRVLNNPGYRTWSESFSDQMEMWTSLRDDDRLRRLLAETNGNLNQSNALTRIGEAFAALVGEGTGLRDAFHNKKLSAIPDEREVHARSETLTGAAYKFFLTIYGELKTELGAEEALRRAGQIMGFFMTRANDYVPENRMTLEDVAKAYLKVDKEFFASRYHARLVEEFTRREIFAAGSVSEWLAHEAATPQLWLHPRWPDHKVEQLIRANLDKLGVGSDFGLKLQSVTRINYFRRGIGSERTIVRVQLTQGRGEGATPLDNHGIFIFPRFQNQPDPTGKPVGVVVFADPNGAGQPPAGAQIGRLNTTVPGTSPADFFELVLPNGPTINSGDFYIGFQAPSPHQGVGFGVDTSGQSPNRSFYSTNGGASFASLAPALQVNSANAMIRAVVSTGGPTPTPTPTPQPGGNTVALTSGVPQNGSIPAPQPGGGLVGETQYTIRVPNGATQLKVDLSGNPDVDLFVRFGARIAIQNGAIVSDFKSESATGNESITITPGSSPAPQAGLYYIAVGNFGPGAANFTVTATVTGGGGGNCSFTISPTSRSLPAAGGLGNVSVTTTAGCNWTATSNASFINILPPASGSGSGSITYSVAANTGANSRTGTLTVAGQTFTLTQEGAGNPQPGNRVVRVGQAGGAPGGQVSVPIELVAQGDENALGFSLTFDPAVLGNPQAALGSDASGATLNPNTSQVGSERLGIVISLPFGQKFSAGARQIVVVTFTISSGASGSSTQVGFGDQPITREISDVSPRALQAGYTPGAVTIGAAGYEADVAPRPNGNGSVTITDWVQIGRFVVGQDTPSSGEFQRADTAPRESRGNGSLTITDWVQAGRYAAGLDAPTPSGGPASQGGQGLMAKSRHARADAAMNARAVRISSDYFERGQQSSVVIELDAEGNENALGFSLDFDPAQLRFVSVTAGRDATGVTLNVNTSQASEGSVGLALALPAGQTIPAGQRQIIVINFAVAAEGVVTAATLNFGDQPVMRELSDANANSLPASFNGGKEGRRKI